MNVSIVDYTSFSGEWCTAVDVVVVDSSDAAKQTNPSEAAVSSLTQALKDLAPYVILNPDEHRAQLCAEFCTEPRDRLCREFSHFGSCPRGATCRWAHAMVETFMINIFVAPTVQDEGTIEVPSTATCERWQPKRPPMPAVEEAARSRVKEVDGPKAAPMTTLAPDVRAKNPKLVSKKKWSDINDESDDELGW
jgi:hypothetical protein